MCDKKRFGDGMYCPIIKDECKSRACVFTDIGTRECLLLEAVQQHIKIGRCVDDSCNPASGSFITSHS